MTAKSVLMLPQGLHPGARASSPLATPLLLPYIGNMSRQIEKKFGNIWTENSHKIQNF